MVSGIAVDIGSDTGNGEIADVGISFGSALANFSGSDRSVATCAGSAATRSATLVKAGGDTIATSTASW